LAWAEDWFKATVAKLEWAELESSYEVELVDSDTVADNSANTNVTRSGWMSLSIPLIDIFFIDK